MTLFRNHNDNHEKQNFFLRNFQILTHHNATHDEHRNVFRSTMSNQNQKSQNDLLENVSLIITNYVAFEKLNLKKSMSRCCNVKRKNIEITIEKSKMKYEKVKFDVHEI